MKRSEQIAEIATALSKFQGQIKNATKDKENPFFHSFYTDLAGAWDAIRKPLSDNGLAVTQDGSVIGDEVIVTSLMLHVSGQWIESEIKFKPTLKKLEDPKDKFGKYDILPDLSAQSVSSCLTYGRRILLMSQTGLAGEDDDAESATEHDQSKGKRVSEKPPIELVQDEKPKAEGESYFSKIIAWMNTAKIADEAKIKVLAEARKNKADEAALKEQYEKLSK